MWILTLSHSLTGETYSCSVGSQSPTSALLNLPPALAGEDISLVYSCSQAMTSLNKVISTATTAVQLTGLLPSCKYSFEVSYSGDKMLVCETTTPPGQGQLAYAHAHTPKPGSCPLGHKHGHPLGYKHTCMTRSYPLGHKHAHPLGYIHV